MVKVWPISLRQSTQEHITGWLFASPWILGFLLLTALGRDYKSESLKRLAQRKLARPGRVARR